MSIPLDTIPEPARHAWLTLRNELTGILGNDLVVIWAYGSVVGADRPMRPADLDTHVILRRAPDPSTARRIEQALDGIGGVEFDVWFVTLDEARRNAQPPHAFREGRRDTAWAIHRSHWLAGRVVTVHGPDPMEIVVPPTWDDVKGELDRELEHIERHLQEGDTDPYEAAYAVLNGSRILHSLETRDPVMSKRDAGNWALDHLPDLWRPALEAALRAHDERHSAADARLLAAEMAPFVAMVRQHLPPSDGRATDDGPRWSGY